MALDLLSLTNGQRAEVKRVLHCDATTSVDMDALLSETLPAVAIFHPDNYKFIPTLSSYPPAVVLQNALPHR